jgi:cardiolipin synthase
MIGTANMDSRSFDLNFEVNAIVYDEQLANELVTLFNSDL